MFSAKARDFLEKRAAVLRLATLVKACEQFMGSLCLDLLQIKQLSRALSDEKLPRRSLVDTAGTNLVFRRAVIRIGCEILSAIASDI